MPLLSKVKVNNHFLLMFENAFFPKVSYYIWRKKCILKCSHPCLFHLHVSILDLKFLIKPFGLDLWLQSQSCLKEAMKLTQNNAIKEINSNFQIKNSIWRILKTQFEEYSKFILDNHSNEQFVIYFVYLLKQVMMAIYSISTYPNLIQSCFSYWQAPYN